ncbi:hypothetical protein H8F21_19150 [Pseudomonas sp. P66]|jgi:hypothetical protein|uniref:DUF3616 domain-containing protein n=1 Tax=Pseudomonas arcuscaelestis TaxID=2710591 RepID=A0ABS2C1U5_9PSED|nr:hypothetical protein [Pseudomonas arcuscaelestis]MBM3110477.1 hypothetical protein [Pseudomonas arcuscaelestis]MBM5459685.1 hypothetical protein [Pseudomonas arcuscaelestis]
MSRPIRSFTLSGLMLYHVSAYAAPGAATVESVQHHFAPCYAAGHKVNCEVSGVARIGETLLLANDKPMPNPADSAVFTMALKNNRIIGTPSYLAVDVLRKATKYEALTTTLDGRFVIASTAFNKEGSALHAAADARSTLLYWPVEAPEKAQVISPSTRGNVTSSRSLREHISHAIGTPYYQIEALTTAPGNRLLVGIRKHGASRKTAGFSFLLLSVPFAITDSGFVLGETFEVVWNLPPDQLMQALDLPAGSHPELGISAIEFDRYNQNRFYAATSFERGNTLGGFLWVLPLEGDKPGRPQAVRLKDGSPLQFTNKPEGIEVLDNSHVLVVHDDDRVRMKNPDTGVARQPHEFAYSVITFSRD